MNTLMVRYGTVRYYNPKWDFINGWKYTEGVISGKIFDYEKGLDPQVATRSIYCYTEYWIIVASEAGLPTVVRDVYMFTYCYGSSDSGMYGDMNHGGCSGDETGGGDGGSSGNNSNYHLPIIDADDIRSNPKTNCIYTKLTQTNIMSRYLRQFDGDFPVSHLKFTFNPNLLDDINGRTYKPDNYWINIALNPRATATNPTLIVAKTLVHEVIHAEIYRKLLSISQTNGAINETDLLRMLEAGDFPGLFDYYSRYTSNQAQHEMMAQHYIDAIAGALKEFDQNQHSDSFYSDMA